MLPKNKPLSEIDILNFTRDLSSFRGVFMRNNLPKKCSHHECAVINLDDAQGPGTHWVAFYKKGQIVYYFDSFGNLQPPLELMKYLGSNSKILYNYKKYQNYNTVICGHLCLRFLYDMEKILN